MRKQLGFIILLFLVFIGGMFLAGPWVQDNLIEANQPYLIVDPDRAVAVGCVYDYLTYLPVEVTGLDPSQGIKFPVTQVPVEFEEYVHYPDSWTNPFNPFNPANQIGSIINIVGGFLIGVLGAGIIAYLILLWKKGAWKKLNDKVKGEDDSV